MDNVFEVNKGTCNQDGICSKVCPVHVIDFQGGGYPEPVSDAQQLCIRCGHCVAVCPTGSFRHRDVDFCNCPPVQPGALPSSGQIGYLLQSRRSIRVYKERPVAPEIVARMIEMAGWAPSAHNAGKVQWLVFSGRERLRRLAGITVDWMRWAMEVMPERAAELNFGRRIKQWEAGVDGILRGAPALIVVHGEKEAGLPPGVVTGMDNRVGPLDYAISLSQLELAAVVAGVGTCWAGYVYKAANQYPPMHAALDLPGGHQCYGAMMVGYPGVVYRRIPQRRVPDITWRL